MGINTERIIHELNYDPRLLNVYNTFDKYTNYRFDYVIRTSFTNFPIELNYNGDYSAFDHASHTFLLSCINNNGTKSNINKLRQELKTLTREVNSKRKEINLTLLNEDGLKKNIKHLEDIISIKEKFIIETANFTEVRCNAKEKVQKEYCKTNKKYTQIISQLNKSHRVNLHFGVTTDLERLNERLLKYEDKIKKMDGVIQIATDSEEKLEQYKDALLISKNRLKIFFDQLSTLIKNKQELTLSIIDKEKRIHQLRTNLSNLGVLSSIEKSRVHTSSNFMKDENLKQEFFELQNLRTEVLSTRPIGMFNPKYQKVNNLTKEEIRSYFENDETINSIDYVFELKNNRACKNEKSLFKKNSNETTVFLKLLSVLNIEEIQKLLVHYFNRVVDLKESEKENDDIIAKLDETHDKQRRNIITLNNNFQEFHLSIEKKCTGLKKYYQDKLHLCFQLFQDECTALSVYRMKQEISSLKKKIIELEKSKKPKESVVTPDRQESRNKSSNEVNTSVSGSESTTAIKLMNLRNKLKINRKKSK